MAIALDGATRRQAVVFPGQGCQKVGMAQDFFSRYPESRDVFERASEAINVDIESLCFSENPLLGRTEYTQPAILTAETAIFVALQHRYGLTPTYFAGHSLGEYTALVAAGAISLEVGVRIVHQRGAYMQQAVEVGHGAMAAIILENLSLEEIEEYCMPGQSEIANINSRDQIVISGEASAVTLTCDQLKAQHPNARIVPLDVSAPFHSSLMNTAMRSFREFLERYRRAISPQNIARVLSNYTGKFHSLETIFQNLVAQMSAPVRWRDNMETLGGLIVEAVEIGPQRVLGRFFSGTGVECKSISDLRSLGKYLGGSAAHAI